MTALRVARHDERRWYGLWTLKSVCGVGGRKVGWCLFSPSHLAAGLFWGAFETKEQQPTSSASSDGHQRAMNRQELGVLSSEVGVNEGRKRRSGESERVGYRPPQ